MKEILSVKSFKNKKCRLCGSNSFSPFLNLGKQPLANELLEMRPVISQKKFPLNVVVCDYCGLFQLNYVVSPERLFENYKYYSSTSRVFIAHFEKMAKSFIKDKIVKKGSVVIDIGSNDGILLKAFQKQGCQVLGVEPSTNLSDLANAQGIPTINDWLTPVIARQIRKDLGKDVSLVTMTNVFAHIHDSGSVLEAVKILIGKNGTLVIEVPDLEAMIKEGTFDLIYHEHLSYFSRQTLALMLGINKLLPVKIDEVDVHGGSLRIFAKFYSNKEEENFYKNTFVSGFYKEFESFEDLVDIEGFKSSVQDNKIKTVKLINKLKKDNKTIVGYGVPAKSSTILNFYKLGRKHFDFMVDDSPAKQGLYTPNTFIKIENPDSVDLAKIDYLFIFAWNFADSIKEKARKQGFKGKFIIPFPEVRIEK